VEFTKHKGTLLAQTYLQVVAAPSFEELERTSYNIEVHSLPVSEHGRTDTKHIRFLNWLLQSNLMRK